ncbi:MAG: hypothetical protein AB1798_00730 [Spirochaetota bacterium]
MKIALMHYHLQPGGVTTVIREQFAVLRRVVDCLILTGESSNEPNQALSRGKPFAAGSNAAEEAAFRAAVRVVPGIGYDSRDGGGLDPSRMAKTVMKAMTEAWGSPADILHVHNPTLNKNSSLPAVLRLLQEEGIALFLQVHDLAEDGRPSAFYPSGEYPEDCHYGTVNSRDRAALLASGLCPDGIHLLFNVVRPVVWSSDGVAPLRRSRLAGRRMIYPVRGIRRKNIGEALFLGVLLGSDVSVTLPPRNAADRARYEAWKDFAQRHGVEAGFDAGLACRLDELMSQADAAVTTSVNEGFGFSFLEPWTAGVAVMGRRLDHVCRDFEEAGVSLPYLYSSLQVPIVLFDAPGFFIRWRVAITAAFQSFGRAIDGAAMERACSAMTAGGFVDFAALDEEAQREVIARTMSSQKVRQEIEALNPIVEGLRSALAAPDPSLAEGNRTVIIARYGPERYSELLRGVYRAVVENPVRHRINRGALLDRFLRLKRFRMLEQR